MESRSRNGDPFGRGGHGGRFFKPSSPNGFSRAHDSDYTARYDNASGVSLDTDAVVDRRRDRKERRRRERQEKKQSRIQMHERLAEERRRARQEAHERKAVAQTAVQRKRQRSERSAARSERSATKRQNLETSTAAARGKTVSIANASHNSDEVATAAFKFKSLSKQVKEISIVNGKENAVVTAENSNPIAVLPLTSSSDLAATSAVLSASTTVPPQVTEKVRRLVNKLTMTNVVDLTNDLSEFILSAGVPRAAVVKGLAQQIERLCRLETGPMNTTGTLPFAGLLRGMQLLHGNQVGAELVEQVSFSLQSQLAAAEEAAAGNTLTVLAQLYLLYGIDVVFVMSLLRMLLRQSTRILEDKTTTTAREGTSGVASQAVCAAACALALMRACGEKLLKEAPSELEAALQEARKVSAQMRSVTGTARFSALVEVMGDIAAGRTRNSRRTATEDAAPVESMLEDFGALLPGQEKASPTQRRAMKRLVLSTNIVTGLTWDQVTTVEKPPRWYMPGVMAAAADNAVDARHKSKDAVLDDDGSETHSASSESDSSGEELDEHQLKRERIARMRVEEKAVSAQRLNTEHKREIFRCIASATDDLECFTMLMYRDPGYTRFHDVCSVLLQCAYQEKKYNPYYVRVLMRFCSARPACVKTLQFAIWDRFKAIRIDNTDIIGYFNFACCMADLIENGVFNLGILRGLDLENTNKTIGLFTRMLILRLIFQLPAGRLTQLFFGGDGHSAHDLQVDTSALRRLLVKFVSLYFVDENTSKRWLPNFYDVVAAGTVFDTAKSGQQSSLPSMIDAKERRLLRNADGPTCTLSANTATPAAARGAAEANKVTSPEALLAQYMARVQVVYKALKQGIS